MRSDNPAYLTQAGWAALWRHGVRTVVALRTIGTADDEPAEIPNEVEFVRVDLEDSTDIESVADGSTTVCGARRSISQMPWRDGPRELRLR